VPFLAFYLQLTEAEQAFKELKHDLTIRPIYHQTGEGIEAHILVPFLADCLQVTLKQRLRSRAPGLTPRSVLDKMTAIQMVDVHLPTAARLFRRATPNPNRISEVVSAVADVRGLKVRHDNGSQYMSDHFQKEITFLGIESSPAFLRAPDGNGCPSGSSARSRRTCFGSGRSNPLKPSDRRC
jgi:hypothetical protein